MVNFIPFKYYIYIVMEKQQFGFQYSFFNLITRILSLYIGGLLGNARLALILFSISGILVYSYLCLKMLFYSGIENSKVIKILYSNFCLFIPVGIILIALKIAQVNHIIIVLCSCVAIIIYYIYIMNTDMQLKQIISQFIPNRIIN